MLQEQGTMWFLVQLKPNSAQIANRNLKRQGFKTFLPMQEETKCSKGRFTIRLRPLFPGYIFVAFDVACGLWHSVNSTHGITKLVSFGKEPAQVPTDLVTQLMLRCDASNRFLPPSDLNPGDKVRLNTGPFANFVAEIEKIAPDQRAWVLMDILGQQSRVIVGRDQLQAI
ncbi:transcription termination/antitermination protein NusG [Kordiimonas sp.]|uniref:transcription termination/antitermination protein NusG n=1 Tax=Kordiimonas sp. TaxID=1970157 RepID=UPI003B523FDE